mmetsp:Transcript_113850/g.318008  ORF Transcript_113850/g.318008 Transcript_113850/m.318008 type:complete len:265 (-) Transcript_113850:191-985(-)
MFTRMSRSSALTVGTMALNSQPCRGTDAAEVSKIPKLEVETYWPPRRKATAARSISAMLVAQPTQSRMRSNPLPATVSSQRSRKLITSSAPKARIHSTQLGGTVTVTCAPTNLANCKAMCPAPRLPPKINTLESPAMVPKGSPFVEAPFPVKRAWYAVSPARGSPAISRRSTWSGTFETRSSGQAQYSAKVPSNLLADPFWKDSCSPKQQTTRSPTRIPVSHPSPNCVTSPTASKPGTKGNATGNRSLHVPDSSIQSAGSAAEN